MIDLLAHYAPVLLFLTGMLAYAGVLKLNAWFASGGLAKIEENRQEDEQRTIAEHSCRFVAEDSDNG